MSICANCHMDVHPSESPIDSAAPAAADARRWDCLALTSAIAAGDAHAFEQFYRRWVDVAFHLALRRLAFNHADAHDVVQNVMLKVIRSLPPLDSPHHVEAWLRITTVNACRDLLRKNLRSARLAARVRRRFASSSLPQPSPLPDSAQLAARLAQLSRDEHAILAFRFRLGWSLAKIGSALGLNPGTVQRRLTTLLLSLRAAATDHSGDSP